MNTIDLATLAEVTSGQSAPQDIEAFGQNGHPFIRAGSLASLLDGTAEENLELLTEEGASRHRMRLFPPDTVVFAKSGMSAKLGRVYRLRSHCYVVSHLAVIIPGDNLHPGYLQRWLEHNPPSRLIPNSAYPSIRLTEISKLQIPHIDFNEQTRIATILDNAETIRSRRSDTLLLADELKKSIFLDMFGDPVLNSKQWDTDLFGKVGMLDRGRSRHRPRNAPELLGGPYPLIQTGDVANSGGYIRSYTQTYSELGLEQSKMWPPGTLCITIAANIAKTAILTIEACFPDSVVGFTPNERVRTEYVQYWLSFLQRILEENAPESAQKNINLEILRSLEIPLPPIELQDSFVVLVQRIEATMDRMREASSDTETLYNCLLQNAFLGEL